MAGSAAAGDGGPVRFRFIEDPKPRWALSGGALLGLVKVWAWVVVGPDVSATVIAAVTSTAIVGFCVWALRTQTLLAQDTLEFIRFGRRRRIPWTSIAGVEVEESWNVGQRIVVRLPDGERVRLPAPLGTTVGVGGALREIETRRSAAAGGAEVQR